MVIAIVCEGWCQLR